MKTNALPSTRREFVRQGAGVVAGMAAARTPAGARPSARTAKIGIVGGRFGRTFQWHLHPHCKVEAVCDIQPQALQALSEVYRCGNTYDNFQSMLKHPGLDAIGVFTPAPLHEWMATTAMKAGKHVISAVPAGLSVEELERLIDTVRETGMRYMMAETSYYRPEIMTCREWAKEGKFGTIFYSESEYHHEGLIALMYDDRGLPTWRHGFPPFWYPTHCTGMVVPITGERLVEVQAIGWGDGHEVVRTNRYQNPFWSATGFFKTSGGHSSRIAVFWHVAAGGTERAHFYGDRRSYIMHRPEGSPDTVVEILQDGKMVIDGNGYPAGRVRSQPFDQPDHLEKLPEPLRVKTGHGNSHTFLTHEFVQSIVEDRHPSVNVWEAMAYTLPGLVAHESALNDGEPLKIRDYGRPPES
ncbi:MAG: Gfo/Idh/MocA family oxidoreductase [Bryobacterales bacterium]|nr:Gfo/Idh/MocA family oxidoreductase [Bryobacterales bacterium]